FVDSRGTWRGISQPGPADCRHARMETPAAAPFPSSATAPGAPTPPPEGWAVPAGRGVDWWGSAGRLFTAAPFPWIFITIVYIAILMVLSFIPLLGQLVVSLLNPVFLGGIM